MAFDAEKFRSAFDGTKKQDFVFASTAYFEYNFTAYQQYSNKAKLKIQLNGN